MKKTHMPVTESMAENRSQSLNRSKLPSSKEAVIATLTFMVLAGIPTVLNLQQQSIAQKQQQLEHSNIKLTMPVLALGGEYSFGNAILNSMRPLATDVRGGIVPLSGHWIAEERPDFLVKELVKFFNE